MDVRRIVIDWLSGLAESKPGYRWLSEMTVHELRYLGTPPPYVEGVVGATFLKLCGPKPNDMDLFGLEWDVRNDSTFGGQVNGVRFKHSKEPSTVCFLVVDARDREVYRGI